MRNWRSSFENIAPKNPTQNLYRRLHRLPGNVLDTAFTKTQDRISSLINRGLETRYTRYRGALEKML